MSDFHWTHGIWLTFLLYLFTSVAGWRLAETVRCKIGYPGLRERAIWRMEAILLLTLAANTVLNGLGGLTAVFRSDAMAAGWYASRAVAQSHLIGLLLGAFAVAATVSLYWARAVSGSAFLALLILFLLITFVLARAVSLHAVDQILFTRIVTFSSLIEAGGIFVTLLLMLWRREQLAHKKDRPKAATP